MTRNLRDLLDAFPEEYRGPWRWYGQLKWNYMLSTVHHGLLFIMGFERLHMNNAQPSFAHKHEGDKYFTMTKAKDLAVREVPYRDDIVDIDNPFAQWIAAASPSAVKVILDESDRLRDALRSLEDYFVEQIEVTESPGTRQILEGRLEFIRLAVGKPE